MKKLMLLASACCLSLALAAAPEKVASARLGGVDKIVAAAGQVGKFVGNEMLGATASAALMNSEALQYFGPTRKGANIFFQIYVDPDKKGDDCVSATVLYPVVAKKAKFLKHHAGAVEKNGVIEMPADGDGDKAYVVFSADGQWASLADTPAMAKAALADIAEAERPLGSELLHLDIASRGMKGLCDLAESTRAEGADPETRIDRATLDILKSVDYCSVALKVTEAGVDLPVSIQIRPGTELAKTGLEPYDAKAFAALGSDVFFAVAAGRNSQMADRVVWKDIVPLLRRHGLKLDFLKRTEVRPGTIRYALDPKVLVATVTAPDSEETLAKFDAEKFLKDYQTLATKKGDLPYVAKSPAETSAFVVKGLASGYTPSQRLEATLPELAGRKPFSVVAGSCYGLTRSLLPVVVKQVDAEAFEKIEPMLSLLAKEEAAGFALAAWREGDSMRGVLRISAAEIRGYASLFTIIAALGNESDAGDDDAADEGDSADGDAD